MQWNPERVLGYRRNAEILAAPMAVKAQPAVATSIARKQRIGIWDLNASAGSLPHILDAIEEAQTYFSFYCVEAAFQIGLTTPGDHVATEWKRRTGDDSMSRGEAAMNVSASPIFKAARPVLHALPLEWLVIVVRSMIADEKDLKDPRYNLFATTHGRMVLLSTCDLREYAAQAGRPFEAAVACIALSMVLQKMVPGLAATPGTIFDFCENRSDIVKVIRTPRIDKKNRERIPAEILEPTDKVLAVLTEYKGSTTPAQMRRQREVLAKKPAQKTPAAAFTSTVSFTNLLKTLNASLSKPAAKKRALAKKHAKKAAKRSK